MDLVPITQLSLAEEEEQGEVKFSLFFVMSVVKVSKTCKGFRYISPL